MDGSPPMLPDDILDVNCVMDISGDDDPDASTVHVVREDPNKTKNADRGSICEYLRNTDVIL